MTIGILSYLDEAGITPAIVRKGSLALKYPNFENASLWLSSPELDFLDKHGISYTIKYGLEVPMLDISTTIKELFSLRHQSPAYSTAYKLIMNSAYGKFAQKDIDTKIFEFYDKETLKLAKAKNSQKLDEKIRKEVLRLGKLKDEEYTYSYKAIGNEVLVFVDSKKDCKHRNIIAASYITAKARLHLAKMNFLADSVAYNDTDSLITDDEGLQQLSPFMGDLMGQMKEVAHGDAEIFARKAYRIADYVKHKGGKKLKDGTQMTEFTKVSPYETHGKLHAFKEATLKQFYQFGTHSIEVKKNYRMDLRKYRDFSNGSKPYLLSNYHQPFEKFSGQVGLM